MKKVLYCSVAFLAALLLVIPTAAQKGRSNRGGNVRGNERAEEVQEMNKKADANRGFTVAPGVEKAESKKKDHDADRDKDKGKHKGRHKGKGKGHH